MLRSLVLVLLLANAGFYAWSHGWLNDVIGIQPDAQREPQRLKQQVNADQLTVVTPSAAGSSSPAAQPSTEASAGRTICVEAGPFTEAEQPLVEATLQPVLGATNVWTTEEVTAPGLWLTYMGPYADADTLTRKLTELRRIRGLNFEEINTPASLAPGLSLGRYNRLEDANAALTTLKLRGIRTARVVTLRPATQMQVVRVAQADIGTQVALSSLKLPQGKSFAACRS
jgi:hypothetical protein